MGAFLKAGVHPQAPQGFGRVDSGLHDGISGLFQLDLDGFVQAPKNGLLIEQVP